MAPGREAKKKRNIQNEVDLISSSGFFDRDWYLSEYPEVAKLKIEPARHYLFYGGFEGKDPSPKFSSQWYSNMYSDVFAEKINPLTHYIKYGQREGRYPNMNAKLTGEPEFLRVRAFQIVPYYLDSNPTAEITPAQKDPKIAVHFHLHYRDMLDQCVNYLNNIPFKFDLYVSITEKNDPNEISTFLQKHVRLLNSVTLRKVPSRGRDLAPLIVEFGKDLLKYDFVAHIHTKKSPHNLYLQGWFEDIMDTLLGSQSSVHQIINLLSGDAKFVYPAPNRKIVTNENGWGDNYNLAKDLLPKLLGETIDAYPLVEFPQGSMFWAKSTALKKFLNLSLTYNDFPAAPIPGDETMMHVLERILLVSATHLPGRNYHLYLSRSTIKEAYFELQKDYSQLQKHTSVKVALLTTSNSIQSLKMTNGTARDLRNGTRYEVQIRFFTIIISNGFRMRISVTTP
ncbi:MAG: hypothetical protein IPN58_15820 [Anaerolineales bacterium]|nr:hypothetical protein [Anaerolineales bacterium]